MVEHLHAEAIAKKDGVVLEVVLPQRVFNRLCPTPDWGGHGLIPPRLFSSKLTLY
jgi:hypothetical protein